jgi:hypothetical protein
LFLLDNEIAAINALKKHFGVDVKYKTCLFHWSQAIQRKGARIPGIAKTCEPIALWWKHVRGCVFLPLELFDHTGSIMLIKKIKIGLIF